MSAKLSSSPPVEPCEPPAPAPAASGEQRCTRCSSADSGLAMLGCGSCGKFFHQGCLDPPPPAVLHGDLAYKFECSACSADGVDHFDPLLKQWAAVVKLLFYNLALQANGDWDRGWTREEVLSFFEQYTSTLTAGRSFNPRAKRDATSDLIELRRDFYKSCYAGAPRFAPTRHETGMYTTRDRGQVLVRAETRPPPKKKLRDRERDRERERDDGNDDYDPKAGRRPKRPREKSSGRNRERRRRSGEERERAAPSKTIIHIQPTVTSWRKSPSVRVTTDPADCAPQLKVSDDGLTVSGQKGYRMTRASHFVWSGAWYFEVSILEGKGENAQRLGWSTGKGDLQAPVGYDRFSYSVRSVDGQAFHRSIGKPYGKPFTPGDVVGCYIRLPPQTAETVPELEPPQPIPVMVQGRGARAKVTILQPDRVQKAATGEDEKPLAESEVRFFLNGEDLGVAFSGLTPGPSGGYHPAVSLWSSKDGLASVALNFGPEFKYPLPAVLPGGAPQPVSAIGTPLFEMFPPPPPPPEPAEPAPEAVKRSKKGKGPKGREEAAAAAASMAAAAAAAASLPQSMVSSIADAVIAAARTEEEAEGDGDVEGEGDVEGDEVDDAGVEEDAIETLTASSSEDNGEAEDGPERQDGNRQTPSSSPEPPVASSSSAPSSFVPSSFAPAPTGMHAIPSVDPSPGVHLLPGMHLLPGVSHSHPQSHSTPPPLLPGGGSHSHPLPGVMPVFKTQPLPSPWPGAPHGLPGAHMHWGLPGAHHGLPGAPPGFPGTPPGLPGAPPGLPGAPSGLPANPMLASQFTPWPPAR